MTSFPGLKSLLKKALPPVFFGTTSYAQEGEDLVLSRLLGRKSGGFYVEVGCHHPFRFSNTYLFYKAGWRGICIDPLPGTASSFRRWRPRDIALELAVSNRPGALRYHMFNEPALNTFDAALAAERDGLNGYRIVGHRQVDMAPLRAILAQHAGAFDAIDFFSIDVEGLDLDVLESNDWQRFRPAAVVVETRNADLGALPSDPVAAFLHAAGYAPYAKTGLSVIFVKQELARASRGEAQGERSPCPLGN